ncbi:MAG: hypothetical protein LW834_20675, partial [Cyanobium sp. 49614_E6]|nr:hypothetical protein [Cyanobium sp. 49614_E6]
TCPDPRGMACIMDGFWIDLYLCGATSYAGNTFSVVPSSRIGLSIAGAGDPPLIPAQYGGNGVKAYPAGSWYNFTEVARSFGKRLPTYDEFSTAAFGAPEQTSGSIDPYKIQWERVSKFGLCQATGVTEQFGQENYGPPPAIIWDTTCTDDRGGVCGPDVRVPVFGGDRHDGNHAGTRCVKWSYAPCNVATQGARFCSNHLILG